MLNKHILRQIINRKRIHLILFAIMSIASLLSISVATAMPGKPSTGDKNQEFREKLRAIAAESLVSKYGIALGQCERHFMSSVIQLADEENEGAWTVKFIPKHDAARLGEYRITVSPQTLTSVNTTWTHDDHYTSPVDTISLDRPAWGSAELSYYDEVSERYVDALREIEAAYDNIDRAPLESKAVLSSLWVVAGYPENAFYGMPAGDDLSFAEARSLAEDALYERYSLKASDANRYAVYPTFYCQYDGENNLWSMVFMPSEECLEKFAYRVEIVSPSGNVDMCMKYSMDEIW